MKTQEQKQTEVLNYFNETPKHLFVTNTGVMFKIMTFKVEDVLYYSKLVITKDKASIETREAFKYGMGLKQEWKHHFFPSYLGVKSIPHFKKMRTIVGNLSKNLTIDNQKNQEYLDKLIEINKFFEVETN
jgi:hypothetical protein